MVENQEIEETKTINIYPCKNSRRILTFLADFFMCFIAAIFLFEIAIRPISFAIIDYDNLSKNYEAATSNTIEIFYQNNLLYYSETSYDDFKDSIKYTCENFTKEFCAKNDARTYDVFETYYLDFKDKTIDDVLNFYETKGSTYFDVNNETKTVSMKQEFIDLFKPRFNPKDEMSKSGEKAYKKYEEEFFLNSYSVEILKDVKENDLLVESKPELGTFLSNDKIIKDFDTKIQNSMKIDASIAFVITMIIFYFIVPLCNKKGSTFSEMIMKVERVDIQKFNYLRKPLIITEGLINTLTNTTMLIFIPSITVGFGPSFALTELLSISIVGFIFIFIQLFMMLFTKYNQSIKEFSTHSICVDTDTMDEYYREKGYDF